MPFQLIWRCQNITENLIFECYKDVPKNGQSDGHFLPFQDSQMQFGSKQETLLETTLFFQKTKLGAFESL